MTVVSGGWRSREEVLEGDRRPAARPPRATSRGSGPQPGPGDRARSRRRDGAQRGAQQLARAVADDDPLGRRRRARAAMRRAQRRGVRVGVDRAPQRERRRVDDLRVRRAVPGGAGEVELGRRAPARAAAPRRGARAARARPPPARARRTGGSSRGSAASARRERRRGALEHQEPDAEQRRARSRPWRRRSRTSTPSRWSWPAARRSSRQKRSSRVASASVTSSEARMPKKATTIPSMFESAVVVDLRADPQPRRRGCGPQTDRHSSASTTQHQQRRAARRRAGGRGPPRSGVAAVVHRPGARAAADEQPAGVRGVVARHADEDTRGSIRMTAVTLAARHRAGARRSLRAQIARLERELGARRSRRTYPPHRPQPAAPIAHGGPRLLGLGRARAHPRRARRPRQRRPHARADAPGAPPGRTRARKLAAMLRRPARAQGRARHARRARPARLHGLRGPPAAA